MTTAVSDDLYVGRELLEQGLVDRDELADCVIEAARERKGGQYGRPLGVVLVDRGLISEGQLATLLAKRVDPGAGDATQVSDIALGKLFVASGYATAAQVEECLSEQKRQREAGEAVRRLGELLVERGFSTAQQVMRVLAYQSKRIYQCPSCLARYNVASPKPGTVYRCKKCQQELRPAGRAAAGGGDLEAPARTTDRPENEQAELDRAVALFLRQRQMVRPEALRDAEQIQLDIRRYGLGVPLAEVLRRTGAVASGVQKELDAVDFAAMIKQPGWGDQAAPGYKLLSKIASTGLATIYSAEPVFGGARAAVKLLHPDRAGQERSLKRFRHEAALLKQLQHPNILRATDSGEQHIVLEPVEGRTLGQRMSESGALGVREAVSVVRQVAAALAYLHGHGVVHRDVQPDVILVDANGKAVLADLSWSAPKESDGAVSTDVYSLGITLYALLTGIEPFGAANPDEMMAQQVEEGAPSPNLMVLQAPPPVIRALRKMVHYDPMRRFASMAEVAEGLDQVAK